MAQEMDALTQGVRVGGARTRSDIRLLLCYLLFNIGCPVSKAGLLGLIQNNELINFFEANNALGELAEAGHVVFSECSGEEYVSLSSTGTQVARDLSVTLPVYLQKSAVRLAMQAAKEESRRRSVSTEITRHGSGYMVTMQLSDGNDCMCSLQLFTADSLQADAIREKFKKEPESVYASIVDALTAQ